MKKILLSAFLLIASSMTIKALEPQKATLNVAAAQQDEKVAEIQFDTLTCNLGKLPLGTTEAKCSFRFTNVGEAPLVIHQAIATCGCTVPSYTKDPIKPGESGVIDVTYNASRSSYPGHFKKQITVRSNAKENNVVRLTIEGDIVE